MRLKRTGEDAIALDDGAGAVGSASHRDTMCEMTSETAAEFTAPVDLRGALGSAAIAVGVPLTAEQIEQCVRYTEILLATNAHTNLTRITAPAEVAVKHFADSLTVLRAVPDLASGATVADVGTGAGFPGLVLKIVRPDLHVTLLDSVQKRLTFLAEVVAALGLGGVSLVHLRAEDAGRDPAHRDRYDLVTARAVATLPTLLEWCLPLVRPGGGRFVAMKSGVVDAERSAATNAAGILQARLADDVALTLPPTPADPEPAARRLLVYRKLRPTPPGYPRRPAEIKAALL
jgi:16S rRNA (guanine527-N7)-methyltransferase